MESYREYRPCQRLQPYVDCYWTSTANAAPAGRILPDGCVDFFFDLEADADRGGRVIGAMTHAHLYQPVSRVEVVAVRFRPGGAAPFVRTSMHQLADRQDALPSHWQADCLVGRMRDCRTAGQRVRLLERALLHRLPNAGPVDPRVATAAAWLRQGIASVEQVAAQLHLSRQHLNRLFRQEVGLGPKLYARIERLQRLRRLASCQLKENPTQLALAAGYYDQSHMIGECRRLAGESVQQLAQRP